VSLALGILVLSEHAGLGQVVILALVFGTFSAADNPARQAFVAEVVGRDLIRDAVTLSSTAVNVARVVGPAVAAVLVSTVGLGWCFIANAVSFCFVIASLLLLDGRQLHPVRPVRRAAGQLPDTSYSWLIGAASVVFLTTGNSTIQLASDPAYRRRVTALWSLALVGSTPIGSPIIGAVSQLTSPRWALALGAAASAVAAAIGHWPVSTRSQPGPADTEPVSALLPQPEPLIQPGRSRTSCAS
jgi:MFS family permease